MEFEFSDCTITVNRCSNNEFSFMYNDHYGGILCTCFSYSLATKNELKKMPKLSLSDDFLFELAKWFYSWCKNELL